METKYNNENYNQLKIEDSSINGEYKHLLITRYGIGVYDEKWFELRFPIFAQLTYQSIIGQSDPNFYWCIHIDKEMPVVAKEKLQELIKNDNRIILVEQEYWNSREGIEMVFSKYPNTNILITTKIDDDDVLQQDYVKNINHYVSNNEVNSSTYLGYPTGYRLDIVTGETVEEHHDKLLFISCATNLGVKKAFTTAYSVAHTKVIEYAKQNNFKVEFLNKEDPMWIYVRHQYADSINPRTLHNTENVFNFENKNEVLNKFSLEKDKVINCINYYNENLGKANLNRSLLETTHSSLINQIRELNKKLENFSGSLEEKEKLLNMKRKFIEEYKKLGSSVISNDPEDLLKVKSSEVGIKQVVKLLQHHFMGIADNEISKIISVLETVSENLEKPKFNPKYLSSLKSSVYKDASRELGQTENYFKYATVIKNKGNILELHNGFSLESRIIGHLSSSHKLSKMEGDFDYLIRELESSRDSYAIVYTRLLSDSGFSSESFLRAISNAMEIGGFIIGSVNTTSSSTECKITPVGLKAILDRNNFKLIKIHSGVDILTIYLREVVRIIGSDKLIKPFNAFLNDKSPFNELIDLAASGNIDKNIINLIKLHLSGEYHFIAKK